MVRMLWMHEMSILQEVKDICEEKLRKKYDDEDPWKALEEYG